MPLFCFYMMWFTTVTQCCQYFFSNKPASCYLRMETYKIRNCIKMFRMPKLSNLKIIDETKSIRKCHAQLTIDHLKEKNFARSLYTLAKLIFFCPLPFGVQELHSLLKEVWFRISRLLSKFRPWNSNKIRCFMLFVHRFY